MEPADADAFGAEVERLKALGFALPPGVRAGWTLLRVFDAALIVGLTAFALVMSGLGMAVLPMVPMFGFVLGLGGGILASAAVRRRLLTPLYRTLTRQLDDTLGAVGGTTSAAMPVLFTKPVLPPPPPKYPVPVRPVRVGDPDAVDFDDAD
jgi:hypothetical protein